MPPGSPADKLEFHHTGGNWHDSAFANAYALVVLLLENHLPILHAFGNQLAVIVPVDKFRETPIMKRILPIVGCVPIALITSLAFSAAASPAASARHKTITCPFLKAGRLTFDVPAKLGDLPEIDFDYPAKATLFSFRDGDLLLVAMDEGEPSRLRIVVSAQLNKKSGTYDGQTVVDMGGNQLMLHSGPVRCTIATG